MKIYPINLNISGKKCVVIGGGKVALRKIRGLLEAGALVKVISPEICPEVTKLVECGEISLIRAKFSAEMLDDELILIAATDNPEINRQAAQIAQSKRILANVVNESGGNFFVPSRIQRGELLLTISTGANSPSFSKFLRLMLENELGANFDAGLELITLKRQEVKRFLPNSNARKLFWREILTPEVWKLLKTGKLNELEAKIDNALENFGIESHDGTD